eukprot:1194645-Prorocentrum_minimum.AAC.1
MFDLEGQFVDPQYDHQEGHAPHASFFAGHAHPSFSSLDQSGAGAGAGGAAYLDDLGKVRPPAHKKMNANKC